MVLAIPAAAVLAGAVMLVLANTTWDGLVADDYYQRGMQINRSLARDAEAGRLGLEAVVSFPAPGVVEARLSSVDGDAFSAAASPRLGLRFTRAGRAGGGRRGFDGSEGYRRNLARRHPRAPGRQVVRGTRQRALAAGGRSVDAGFRGDARTPGSHSGRTRVIERAGRNAARTAECTVPVVSEVSVAEWKYAAYCACSPKYSRAMAQYFARGLVALSSSLRALSTISAATLPSSPTISRRRLR